MQINDKEEIFTTVFQPIVNIKEDRIVSMEVLSRSRSGENIESLLKKISLEGNLRKFTMASIEEIKSLSNLIPKMVRYLSLNITMSHICDTYVLDDLNELIFVLAKQHIQLVIELPEGEPYPALNSLKGRNLVNNIDLLREKNVLIAIDDFGKGVNVSETEVLHLMPDVLKVDKDVVQNPNENQDVWLVLESIREKLNLTIVAEGIESPQDLVFVMKKGVCFCQGFYFGRPSVLLA
ncbi:EAL domain-containing protein [Vibrio owensii]